MGSASFVIGEWNSIVQSHSAFHRFFQSTLARLDGEMIAKCNADWSPLTFNPEQPFGSNGHWGRTTILPALFDDHSGSQMAHWRQRFTTAGNQTLMAGTRSGNTIPEDFKIAWAGIAFPNKNQHISEIKWQIGDRKYGRIDIEEMLGYNQPAIIFQDGYLINEEEAFDLYGYVEGPLATDLSGLVLGWQRIVLLGYAAYRQIDRVLGQCGAAI